MKIPFNEKEMEVVAQMPAFGGGTIPVFNYPISTTELAKRTFCDKEALWILNGSETGFFCPSVIPDHVARGFVFEAVPTPREKFGRQGYVRPELEVHRCGRRLHERGQALR